LLIVIADLFHPLFNLMLNIFNGLCVAAKHMQLSSSQQPPLHDVKAYVFLEGHSQVTLFGRPQGVFPIKVSFYFACPVVSK